MDLITVAIPVYNSQNTIERALLSVFNQSYPYIEILIVNDRGADRSMEIVDNVLKEAHTNYKFQIVEHPENRGLGATRNSAIEHANGKYLFFLDSDDQITKECIDLLYQRISSEDYDFIASSYAFVPLVGDRVSKCYLRTGEVSASDLLSDDGRCPLRLNYPLWNKLYSVKFLRDNLIKCVPNHLNEDVWFTIQVLLYMRKAFLLNNVTYLYYETQGSITDYSQYDLRKKSRILNQYMEIDSICKNSVSLVRDRKLQKLLVRYLMDESLRFCNLAFIILTPYTKGTFLKRNTLRLISIYRSKDFRQFVISTLRYPEMKLPKPSFKDRCQAMICDSPFVVKFISILMFGLYNRGRSNV